MNDVLLSLMMAAGISGWVYSKLGRRLGYGNTQSVWFMVAAAFVFVFIFFITLLHFVIHLHS